MQTIDIRERTQDAAQGPSALALTLRPRRSADPRVAYGFCGILGLVWFSAGMLMTEFGGWPVFGFFGAEFAFIGSMVHIFIRRTEVVETIEITPETVRVARRDLRGVETREFMAYWASVGFSGSPTENGTLEIRSHGERIEIGRFLSASEKARLAAELNARLERQRRAVPNPPDLT